MLKTTIKLLTFYLTMFIGLCAYNVWYLREDNSALIEQINSQMPVYQRPAPTPIVVFESAEPTKLPTLAPCENPNPMKRFKYRLNSPTISGGVLNGKLECGVYPAYPAAALDKNISGQVVLDVLVDETGEIVKASIKSGHPLLRQSALNAARQSRTSPTLLGGQSVKMRGVLIYNFDAGAATLNWKPIKSAAPDKATRGKLAY